MFKAFNPIGGDASILQLISPTFSDPIVQWAENKDWSGRKLRPDNNVFAEKPQSQLYWNSVREPSRVIAEKINALTGGDEVRPGKIDISPEAIDLVIDTFTGGMGRFASDAISTPLKAVKGEPVETYEIPFLRKVYGKPGMASLTSDFYDNMDAVRLVDRQVKHYRDDKEKQKEIKHDYQKDFRMIHRAKITQKIIKRLNESKRRAIGRNDTEKVESINAKIQKQMKLFNKAYNKGAENHGMDNN